MKKSQIVIFSVEAGLIVLLMIGMGVMMGIGFAQAKAASGVPARAFLNIAWLSMFFMFLLLILLASRMMRLVKAILREMTLPRAGEHVDAWAEAGRRLETDQSDGPGE
jgi:hypothetical protein